MNQRAQELHLVRASLKCTPRAGVHEVSSLGLVVMSKEEQWTLSES